MQNLFTKPSDSKKCFSQNLFTKPSDSQLLRCLLLGVGLIRPSKKKGNISRPDFYIKKRERNGLSFFLLLDVFC